MACFNELPTEVLYDVVSYVSGDFTNLRNCSLVCRALWEVATPALYSDVDLGFEERKDEESDEKTQRRQLRLIRSLAENPKLGALVRSFKNHEATSYYECQDATLDDDSTLIISAAQNMTHLSKVLLKPSPLAAHIIANLQSYSQLVDLHIYGLEPREHLWDIAPVSLTRLKWEVPSGWNRQDPCDDAQLLVKVVEATCPALESLDICFVDLRNERSVLPTCPPERAQLYCGMPDKLASRLTHLWHFGFSYRYNPTEIETPILSLIESYKHSLQSVSIPIPYGSPTRETLDFILQVCALLPDLKALSLIATMSVRGRPDMDALDFLQRLITALASPKLSIEHFSMTDIGTSFSPAVGKLFSSWTGLQYLRLGDKDNKEGPWDNDGRLDFSGYKGEIMKFIENLPPSLEELFLETNGEGLWCDEDDDFNPVCNLGTKIFTCLRRLHTCDIHAWISNVDGGLRWTPEKGVFYRRLPNQGRKIKDVWTSRMDCIYQESDVAVSVECVEIELEDEEGVFEGKDADQAWLDGYEFSVELGPTGRGKSPRGPDYSWPFWRDRVGAYAGFRNRH